MCMLNIVGFWRYTLMYERYKNKTLSRMDIILNPGYTILDLPWLLMVIVTLILMPWRFFTTFLYLSKAHPHFPKLGKHIVRLIFL